MPSNELMQEAQHLRDVSQRLEVQAEHHPHVSEALLTISGTILSTATLLEVLVATKMDSGRHRPF